jgi:hypothetical protein
VDTSYPKLRILPNNALCFQQDLWYADFRSLSYVQIWLQYRPKNEANYYVIKEYQAQLIHIEPAKICKMYTFSTTKISYLIFLKQQ